MNNEEKFEHLSKLNALNHLSQLSITCANFYEHQVFHLLEVRGDQIGMPSHKMSCPSNFLKTILSVSQK